MADDEQASDGTPDSGRSKGWERRLGEDRREAERRTIEVLVDKDRRSGLERRRGDRRKS